jgi:ribonucleoside-diphosphate reductase alpha chain
MEEKVRSVKKRNGEIVPFDSEKIYNVVKKAFLAHNMSNETIFRTLTQGILNVVESKYGEKEVPHVEQVQDIVELVMISQGFTEVARGFMEYRIKHKVQREEKTRSMIDSSQLYVTKKDGRKVVFEPQKIQEKLEKLAIGLDKTVVYEVVEDVCKTVYDGIKEEEIETLILNCLKARIEDHYDYSYLSARFVVDKLYNEVLNVPFYSDNLETMYQHKFSNYLDKGIELGLLSPRLKEFDLNKLSNAIVSSRDLLFMYLGMQTIKDRYLLKTRKKPQKLFELPQWMWMRVAMGLSLGEENKEGKAIEFYNTLSQLYAVSSTPTLFNSGTTHSQMSSCYLNTVEDSLTGIFKNYSDCAQLSKYAGGIGTDWTYVRAKGAKIRGTNGESQGIIPFVKIYNDVAIAVNQGGKRRGAMAAYLEVWHSDIFEFLELRKNTGDERRRAHDIHTAAFISDLFMKRVREKGKWTLFSPDKVKDLHDLYGKEFEERYEWYEQQNIEGAKTVDASMLWKKILTMLFETGHPWITYKDTINVRSPQDHVGVIHNSNLCTEITLNTSAEETAVCNLGSINLSRMIKNGDIDEVLLKQTVSTMIRMLDNVVDNNFYPTKEAKYSNMRHRPIGLGVMGYQDALYMLNIDYDSAENIEFADKSMEMISYYAIQASCNLAKERGSYQTFIGSKWDRGILPVDTLDLLEKERGLKLKVNRTKRMDWDNLRREVQEYGMRNSNTMAIAPTATISNISGVVPCVEPIYKNIYMKENLSGNFVVINKYLVDALSSRGLWTKDILNKIKLNDGSISNVKEIPESIKRRFKEVFEIDPVWVIECAARRSKWIDQAASTNIFLRTTSGKVVSDVYNLVWEMGIKTTYYLRTLAATQVMKTVQVEKKAEAIVPVENKKTEAEQIAMAAVAKEIVVPKIPKEFDYEICEACE